MEEKFIWLALSIQPISWPGEGDNEAQKTKRCIVYSVQYVMYVEQCTLHLFNE